MDDDTDDDEDDDEEDDDDDDCDIDADHDDGTDIGDENLDRQLLEQSGVHLKRTELRRLWILFRSQLYPSVQKTHPQVQRSETPSTHSNTYARMYDDPIGRRRWSLAPLRRMRVRYIIAALQMDCSVSDMIRLLLLWARVVGCVGIHQPHEIFRACSEIFMLPRSIFARDSIRDAFDATVEQFVYYSEEFRSVGLHVSHVVSWSPFWGQNAFPFFKDLVEQYDSESMGDERFSRVLLAYLNMSLPVSYRRTFLQALRVHLPRSPFLSFPSLRVAYLQSNRNQSRATIVAGIATKW